MFRKDRLSVIAWMVLIIILSIPVVNIIFAVVMFLRGKTSHTVKNFFIAYLIFYCFAVFGMFNGSFENMQGLFG